MELKNWRTLEYLADYVDVKIDPEKPRESRLAVALEYDKRGQFPEAVEVMLGEKDPMQTVVLSMNRQGRDAESFYKDFAPVDYE